MSVNSIEQFACNLYCSINLARLKLSSVKIRSKSLFAADFEVGKIESSQFKKKRTTIKRCRDVQIGSKVFYAIHIYDRKYAQGAQALFRPWPGAVYHLAPDTNKKCHISSDKI